MKKTPEDRIDLEIKVGSEPIDPGATAFSEKYGDLTPKIERTGHVDQNKRGIYEWRYNVADTEGCKAKEQVRKVIVKDGAPCKEWTDTLSNHENEGRAYSTTFWFFFKTYYTKGTDILDFGHFDARLQQPHRDRARLCAEFRDIGSRT